MIQGFAPLLEQGDFGGFVTMAQLWARYDLVDTIRADRHQRPIRSQDGETTSAHASHQSPAQGPETKRPYIIRTKKRKAALSYSGCSIFYKTKEDCDPAIKAPTPV